MKGPLSVLHIFVRKDRKLSLMSDSEAVTGVVMLINVHGSN